MPHEKFKSENYENFGGMNTKASAYISGPREFLNITNYDFSIPGSLSGRPGSTQFLSTTFSGGVNYISEYIKAAGFSQIMVGHPGGLWSAIGTAATGISTTAVGATINNIAPYAFGIGGLTGFGLTNFCLRARGITLSQGASFPVDSVFFNDWLFMADGNNMVKWNGATMYRYGIPYGANSTFSVAGLTSGSGFTYVGGNTFVAYKIGYVNNRGVQGPLEKYLESPSDVAAFRLPYYTYGYGFGSTINYVNFGLTTPSGYGISQIAIYKAMAGITGFGGILSFLQTAIFQLHAMLPGDATFFADTFEIGKGTGVNALVYEDDSVMPFEKYVDAGAPFRASYYPGQSFIIMSDWDFYCPKFLEIFSGRMFMAGFDKAPNLILYSEIVEPEQFFPENNLSIETPMGDIITGLKEFNGSLIVGKELSIHQVQGTEPANIVIRPLTNEYGVLNNRCFAAWGTKLWMLSKDGVIEFDGANVGPVSDKMRETFEAMNLSAAVKEAVMLHNPQRREIMISFPINGATTNNVTVIYDYTVGSWAKWDGFTPKSYAMMKGRNTVYNAFYGDSGGRLNQFGSSYFGDNGAGISTVAQGRFEHPEGQTVEKMFRRLFTNIEKLQGGVTTTLNVGFRQGYTTGMGVTRVVVSNKSKQMINFGISSNSLSVEVGFNSATERIRYYGYTLQYRWQRDVYGEN
jgi:hypothetical protein